MLAVPASGGQGTHDPSECLQGAHPPLTPPRSETVDPHGGGCSNGGMPAAPPVRYARADGADLAYQVFGEGGPDVMAIPPFAQNIELMWDRPEMASMFDSLGSFARWVHFDKRGTGASDRTVAVPTLDERVDDTRAVMDAAGLERAVIYGVSEGGPMAMLFAATYPERVTALVLHATAARFVRPGETEADRERRHVWNERFVAGWGTDRSITLQGFAVERGARSVLHHMGATLRTPVRNAAWCAGVAHHAVQHRRHPAVT